MKVGSVVGNPTTKSKLIYFDFSYPRVMLSLPQCSPQANLLSRSRTAAKRANVPLC